MNINKTNTGSGLIGNNRYSGYYLFPMADDPSSSENEAPGASSGSGSSAFDKIDYNGLAGTIGSIIQSIFGKSDQYVAESYKLMYENQQKTTMVLWVVIGLMLALGVVLLIRKTK